MVLIETKLTESSVSRPHLAANIVVTAAVGALQDMTEEISISPLIPQMNIIPNAIRGKTKSFSITENMQFKFLNPDKILLLAKWYPIIIIGRGVLSDEI